jgi:hypothetical protein
LIEIEGDGGYEIVATLDADLASSVRPGTTLAGEVDSVAEAVSATVTAVSPAGDPTTHRFELRADVAAASGLRSGLFARLSIPSREEARLTVPSGAVFARGGLEGVFVVAEGRARLRWIAAGAAAGGRTEVRAGLAAGERVALDADDLVDGAAVTEAR